MYDDQFRLQFRWPSDLPIRWDTLRRLALVAIIAIVFLVGLSSSYYTVQANEEAVILRLGEYSTTVGPGLHFKLPFGIDEALHVEVKRVFSAEFGFRSTKVGVQSVFDYEFSEATAESFMLTADLNCAVVNWVIRYRIKDPKAYLFNVRKVDDLASRSGTLRDVSEAVMRRLVGDRSIDEVLTIGRAEIERSAEEEMQEALDSFGCGVRVEKMMLKRVDPPDEVKDSFDAVNRAVQVRDRIINEAEGRKNRELPTARGKKEQVIEESHGYAQKRINEATGDAQAFLAILAEYGIAKEVTRRRLYLETLREVLPRLGKIQVLDKDLRGLVPILPLGGDDASGIVAPPKKGGGS